MTRRRTALSTVTRRRLAGVAAATAALMAATLLSTPAPASAQVTANKCGLPTSARPNSTFIESFYDCNQCKATAAYDQRTFGGTFYCTYNPSNGLTDEHRQW
ncbi:hypothetical protein [Microbispora sp. GKU 823]|uniref:hypothetical protein n=1 Tax=Microbispora sp. GKU 823 TaxID=1652100 RepID=UPI002118ED0A|nr:hypothetical protein [Microbispora sp. GKU 823]